jgi:hypothetical protein
VAFKTNGHCSARIALWDLGRRYPVVSESYISLHKAKRILSNNPRLFLTEKTFCPNVLFLLKYHLSAYGRGLSRGYFYNYYSRPLLFYLKSVGSRSS